MSSLKRWLFPELTRGAVCNGFAHLYHDVSASRLQEILSNHGQIAGPSYWGTRDLAWYYAKEVAREEGHQQEWVMLRVALGRFAAQWLRADDSAVARPQATRIGNAPEYRDGRWQQQACTWQDSLRVYGSVRYEAPVSITLTDVCRSRDDRSTAPQVTLEQITRFLEQHPDWSPAFNPDLTVCGLVAPDDRLFSLEEIACWFDL